MKAAFENWETKLSQQSLQCQMSRGFFFPCMDPVQAGSNLTALKDSNRIASKKLLTDSLRGL